MLQTIENEHIAFIDFWFVDIFGELHNVGMPSYAIDKSSFVNGLEKLDASSIVGFKSVNNSDMILMPDASSTVLDPFSEEATLNIRCDIIEPATMQGYDRDPRSIAKRAMEFLKSTGIGDDAYFGPEPEFFLFDDVRFHTDMAGSFYKIDIL